MIPKQPDEIRQRELNGRHVLQYLRERELASARRYRQYQRPATQRLARSYRATAWIEPIVAAVRAVPVWAGGAAVENHGDEGRNRGAAEGLALPHQDPLAVPLESFTHSTCPCRFQMQWQTSGLEPGKTEPERLTSR